MPERQFNTGDPIAYFITWTTYGTWLPGDERGWNKKRESGLQPMNSLRAETAAAKMKETAFRLSDIDRETVESTIQGHCRFRSWRLHAVSVRSNHVHVVVTAPDYKPETVRDQLKAWSTRKLKPTHEHRKRFWTEGASCRWINHQVDLESAIEYTIMAQSRKGLEQE